MLKKFTKKCAGKYATNLAWSAAALLLLAAPGGARAADATTCKAYADTMMSTITRGKNAKCATFAQANPSWDLHFNWCSGQPPAALKNPVETWSGKLDGCLASGPQGGGASAAAVAAASGVLIVNKLSNKCLVTRGGPPTQNGTPLVIWNCADQNVVPGNRWEFLPGGYIRNTMTKKCIDVAGATGVANGAQVRVWDCEASGKTPNGAPTDHKWALRNGFIVNLTSKKCLDVSGAPGTADGAKAILYDCELSGRNPNGSPTDQLWYTR